MAGKYEYYDELSADGGDSEESDSEESDDDDERCYFNREEGRRRQRQRQKRQRPSTVGASASSASRPTGGGGGDRQRTSRLHGHHDSYVVHMDIDCFYCQCEHVDRDVPTDRPMAIGQKHIVVTCNYAARKFGVAKLQLRTEALRRCPSLLIVEGSDLERYRHHARVVYAAFRRACQRSVVAGHAGNSIVAVRKGAMDEATADLTPAVLSMLQRNGERQEEKDSSAESGSSERRRIEKGLEYAQQLAASIRQAILTETGFTTRMGVSTNPLLAKLATSQKNKNSAVRCILPPRDDGASVDMLKTTPLSQIPGLGRRTVQALVPYLQRQLHTSGVPPAAAADSPRTWTCG